MFKRITLLIAAAAGLSALIAPAQAARPKEREQGSALGARQQGPFLPLREIEARIRQQMRGAEYLGPERIPEAGIYRLKFLRGENIIWVDVDGRTGAIVGRSGN
jgi:hypothetical protein